MPFNPSKFINAGQFGDYSTYSGMGGDQQMKSVKEVLLQSFGLGGLAGAEPDQVSGAAAPPAAAPESLGDMASQQFNQAVAPIKQKMTNISNAWDQASQGNGVAAVNAYRGYAPKQPNTQPFSQPSVINQHYGVEND